ncbi:MAG: iron-containing alcohol dehydrogenase [Clostridiales bacterium]|nr:iron-containing alcohol dehydrogenase [Clostridiales bacterium]
MKYNNKIFIDELKKTVKEQDCKKILFVSSGEYDRFGYRKAIDEIGIPCIVFTDFEPNPEVSSVMKCVEILRSACCDFIVTVGGGSAMDVAKAVKYYAKSDIKILAVPTTAGTGAEVTRFAVLYNCGDKESVSSYDIIPNYQIFDYKTLLSLPYEQRVVTGLDAFCHSVEAYWSINATDESREYSAKSLELFSEYYLKYLDGDESALEPMMKCSELAGRAINIARTTAPHAMSYKLHKLKGFIHGQAVAICLAYIWQYMLENCETAELELLLAEVEVISGYTPESFKELLCSLHLCDDLTVTQSQLDECISGVNIERMQNHPMKFDVTDVENIYRSFLTVENN